MSAEVSRHEGAPPPKLDSATFRACGFGPDRAFACYVAELSGQVIGHVSITWGFDVQEGCRTVWLADLFVAAEHRRKGVGRALIAQVCQHALARGAGCIQFMMAPENQEAAEFYAAIGSKRDRGIPMFLPRGAVHQIAEPCPNA